MKRIVIGLIVGCVLIGAAIYTNATVEAAEPYTVLTVRSAIEGEEVTFKGSYFGTERAGLAEAVEARQTPFQMRVDTEAFVAIFRKLDGEADLDVQLTQAGDPAIRGSAGATGTVCMVMRRSDGGLSSAVL